MHENHDRFEIIIVQQKCKYYLSILAYCPGIFYGTKDFETSSPRVSSHDKVLKSWKCQILRKVFKFSFAFVWKYDAYSMIYSSWIIAHDS